MRTALLEYERNGYNDSDFFVVFFDDETKTIGQKEIGSTRYAGGNNYGDVSNPCPVSPDVLEAARLALATHIFAVIHQAEQDDVLRPQLANIPLGTKVRVIADSSKRARKNFFKAGEVGEVTWFGQFGTFYANGYKQPGRSNTSVCIRRLDGSRVFVPLANLRLDKEPLSDAELTERAESLSHHYNFGAAVSGYTWASQTFFVIPK